MNIKNKKIKKICAAGIFLALLVSVGHTPWAFAGETAEISISGRETAPLDNKGGYVDIVYGDEPKSGISAYRERDTSPKMPEPVVEEFAEEREEIPEPVPAAEPEKPIEPEEEILWWRSRAAKLVYACVGAIVLVAALWHIVRTVKKSHAQKEILAVEENVTAAAFIPPQPVSPQPVPPTVSAAPSQPSRPPEKVEIKLTAVSPTDAKQYVARIADKIEIGRGEQGQVCIKDDTSVSSRHCEISWNAEALYLRDLNSSNGTGVNGVPIRGSHKLEMNDIIELGRVRLRLGEVRRL